MRRSPLTPTRSRRSGVGGMLVLEVALQAAGQPALDADHAVRLPEPGQELGDGASQDRMPEVGGDLAQRDQDEAAFGEQGVGNREVLRSDHLVVVEEDVDVDRSRAVAHLSAPAHALLDALQEGEQRARIEGRDSHHGHVEEARLVGHVRRLASRRPRRARFTSTWARSLWIAFHQVGLTVSEVGSQAEVDGVWLAMAALSIGGGAAPPGLVPAAGRSAGRR